MVKRRILDEETLQEIIRRIVEVAQPERIILFGSAARGGMGPHSDVDLLVIKSGEFDPSRLTGDIYVNLHGVGQAVDVILVTPAQVERYGNAHCLVIAPALREGKEVYRGPTLRTRRPERVAEPRAQ
ncbi:MAG: nucleotidyltransferase domain-containing protein [Anaerolineae bacterium]